MTKSYKDAFLPIGDYIRLTIEEIELANDLAKQGKHFIRGIRTGFVDLDIITSGLGNEVVVVGARPDEINVGDFLLNVALNACRTHKVVYFGVNLNEQKSNEKVLDLNGRKIVQRAVSIFSRYDIGKGDIPEFAYPRVTGAVGNIDTYETEKRLSICTGKMTASKVFDICRHRQEECGLDLAVIDSFNRLVVNQEGEGSWYTRAYEVAQVLDNIKCGLGIASLVACDLKKMRPSEELSLSHLQDFGTLENLAHPILLLEQSRDEYGRRERRKKKDKGINLYVERNVWSAPQAEVNLTYLSGSGKFESCAKLDDFDNS